MTVIDMHAHMVPAQLPDMSLKTGNSRWPKIVCKDDGTKVIMVNGTPFRTITASAWDVRARIDDMDSKGISAQVISPMPLLLSYGFEPRDTQEFGKFINAEIARMVAEGKNRFYGLGMVPLQDPKLAAREVQTIRREYGLSGIEIGTNVNGKVIGDPYFWPFFEAVAAEGLAIFIHPLDPVGADRVVGPKTLFNLVNFPVETALAAISLMTGGVLDRFPGIRIAVSHGGGSLFSILPRFIHGWKTFNDVAQLLRESPKEYARRLYYDILVYDRLLLDHMVHVVGAGRLLIGSDYPFAIQEKEPGRALKQLALPDDQLELIQYRNCLSYLGATG